VARLQSGLQKPARNLSLTLARSWQKARPMRFLPLFLVAGCLSDFSGEQPAPASPTATAVDMRAPAATADLAVQPTPQPVPTCGQQTFPVTVTRKVPNVLLVVDDSGSMADAIPAPPMVAAQTKWDALRMAVKALLTKYPDAVRWGLSIFPQPLGDADSCAPGAIDVAVGPGTAMVIGQKLDAILASTLDGSTPTPETLDAIVRSKILEDPTHDSFIVLLTDGEPSCAPETGVTPLIQSLLAKAVKTFVVGIGDVTQLNPTLLEEWATAGGTARMTSPKYFQASTLGDLTASFDSILGTVASCSYALAQKPDDPTLLTAYFDGQAVAADPQNGATYDDATQSLVFHGKACDQIKNAQVMKIDVVYGCPAPIVS
jgi:hypothetical protein